jgi:hypothetical protein
MLQSLPWTENTHPYFRVGKDKANGLFKGRSNCQGRMGAVVTAPLLVLFVVCSGCAIAILITLIVRGWRRSSLSLLPRLCTVLI